MLCTALSGGLGCSREIKGVLWRLRHRYGTSSPWALWKQKREELQGPGKLGKINKICLTRSDTERKWYVKQGMGHGNQVENRTSAEFDKSRLEMSLRNVCPLDCCLLSECWADSDTLSELMYGKVSLLSAGENPEASLISITETMSESLIMVQLTCPLSQSHKPDVQRLLLSRPTVFL